MQMNLYIRVKEIYLQSIMKLKISHVNIKRTLKLSDIKYKNTFDLNFKKQSIDIIIFYLDCMVMKM